MRTKTAFALALATTALVACDTAETGDDVMVEPGQELPQTTTPPANPMPDQMLISSSEFQAAGDTDSGTIRGTAELRRSMDEGALELHVRIEGLSEGQHAWHIHGAPCGQQGGIVVPLSGAGGQDGIHGDLNVGADGVVEQTVTIAPEHVQDLELETERALNVHQGAGDNPGAPVACANVGGSMTGGAGAGGTAPTTGS